MATSPEYYNSLSKASQSSLKQQGGPFTKEEARTWEDCDPFWRSKVNLRTYDDGAKVPETKTRDLQQWWEVALRVYQGKGGDRVELVPEEEYVAQQSHVL